MRCLHMAPHRHSHRHCHRRASVAARASSCWPRPWRWSTIALHRKAARTCDSGRPCLRCELFQAEPAMRVLHRLCHHGRCCFSTDRLAHLWGTGWILRRNKPKSSGSASKPTLPIRSICGCPRAAYRCVRMHGTHGCVRACVRARARAFSVCLHMLHRMPGPVRQSRPSTRSRACARLRGRMPRCPALPSRALQTRRHAAMEPATSAAASHARRRRCNEARLLALRNRPTISALPASHLLALLRAATASSI
jgi:hypothetical protein